MFDLATKYVFYLDKDGKKSLERPSKDKNNNEIS